MMFFQNKKNDFACPVAGTIVSLDQVNDPVFSQRVMGDGFAVIPMEGKLFAPFDCEVKVAFPTGHAFGLQNKKYEVLIHIGLDTVMLNGEGFTVHVKPQDQIKKGDLIAEFDIERIKSNHKDPITMVIFTSNQTVKLRKENVTVAALEEDLIQLK